MSSNVPDKMILVESSPGEETWSSLSSLLQSNYDRFGGKGILLCGGILLGSHTPLYVFDACTINPQRYRDEILKAYESFKAFKHLDTRKLFVYRASKRFSETSSVPDGGTPLSVRISTLVKAIREKIRPNPCRKKAFLVKVMNMSKRTMCHLVNEDLLRGTPINMATKKSKEKRKMKSANLKLSGPRILRLFKTSNELPTCLICKEKFAHKKNSNLEGHFTRKHSSFSTKYPTGDARKKAVEEF
ncbi:hypothetical protein TNCV_2216561 [Trichonephila clavipes]|nr:hypothetical protein TNCV_2216561 [Trichonephila clavipes]